MPSPNQLKSRDTSLEKAQKIINEIIKQADPEMAVLGEVAELISRAAKERSHEEGERERIFLIEQTEKIVTGFKGLREELISIKGGIKTIIDDEKLTPKIEIKPDKETTRTQVEFKTEVSPQIEKVINQLERVPGLMASLEKSIAILAAKEIPAPEVTVKPPKVELPKIEVKTPEEIKAKIINLGEFPKFPTSVQVRDLKDIIKAVGQMEKGVSTQLETLEKALIKAIKSQDFTELRQALTELKQTKGIKAKEPMFVRIVDKSGRDVFPLTLFGGETTIKSVISDIKSYSVRIDEVSANTTYIGEAAIGSNDSAEVWRIKKVVKSGTVTSIVWAGGSDSFDKAWSKRKTYAYS